MEFELTPGARRAIYEAARWTSRPGTDELEASALLLGLLSESECRAALFLDRQQIDIGSVSRQWPGLVRLNSPLPNGANEHTFTEDESPRPIPTLSGEVRSSLFALIARMGSTVPPIGISTEHILLALVSADHDVGTWLRQRGLDADLIHADICRQFGNPRDPIDLDDEPISIPAESLVSESQPLGEQMGTDAARQAAFACEIIPRSEPVPVFSQAEHVGILRVIDAAANRAREGLRVVEDYVRFTLDDHHLTEQLKRLRHQLIDALSPIPSDDLLASRETQFDVGTHISTPTEFHREGSIGVLTANFMRVEEALRSLEEFGKSIDPALAEKMEKMRYLAYTLQRAVQITVASLQRLAHAQLYVLVDGGESDNAFRSLVESLVKVGVHVLQLREKQLEDRQLLQRARSLREITSTSSTLFIMNDRPDLAVLSHADGVHVGQTELTVKDCRTIVGPGMLVGVSTHSIEQARQAVLDGADYLGVGPTFPTGTKRFADFAGIELLRKVAAEIRLPVFAIGGICRDNLTEVLKSGFSRIAVSGAVANANVPAAAARELLAALVLPS